MVTIYSTDGCSRCTVVKNMLKVKGVSFKVINTQEEMSEEEKVKLIQEAHEKGITSMPLIRREDGELVRLEDLSL